MKQLSILIPLYNHSCYIKELLDSIDPKDIDLEVVILDDGSSDDSYLTAINLLTKYSFPIRVYTQKNAGLPVTLNRLAKLAHGELLAFIASDDLYLPDRFKKSTMMLFEKNNELVVHYSSGLNVVNGKISGSVHNEALEEVLNANNPPDVYEYITTNVPGFFLQGMIIRKSFLETIFGFDEKSLADDWAFNIKVFDYLRSSSYMYVYDTEPVFLYRIHDNNNYKNLAKQFSLVNDVIINYIPNNKKKYFELVYGYYFVRSIIYFDKRLLVNIINVKKSRILLCLIKYFINIFAKRLR